MTFLSQTLNILCILLCLIVALSPELCCQTCTVLFLHLHAAEKLGLRRWVPTALGDNISPTIVTSDLRCQTCLELGVYTYLWLTEEW